MTQPLEIEFEVGCSPEHAFDVWARRTSQWWPRAHSRSGDPDSTITFEGRAGGRIYERASDGAEHEWGEVLEWEPPGRLRYLWHIYGERSMATEVEITFAPAGDATTVRIVHSGFERLGEEGAALRERNVKGWAGLIPQFRSACFGQPLESPQ